LKCEECDLLQKLNNIKRQMKYVHINKSFSLKILNVVYVI
jgi:hypothetical protein